ncbi:MAG TPA: acetylxylan esterase [Candidatus Sulfotelmatobacter sp.]|nr:acetylxylan esterase [Candidatus Sulfotelmatobacter sp.]
MQLHLRSSLPVCLFAAVIILAAIEGQGPQASAQADARMVGPWLQRRLQSEAVVAEQLRRFMLGRVPPLRLPTDAAQWTAETERRRAHELEIVYHGWPQDWIDAPPKFEEVGTLEGRGYRIRKLRYEVVPGMYSAALLYEPEHFTGKLPAVLNLHGHGSGGKAVEHKQKRCINQARRGMLALSLEWFGFGELDSPENDHSFVGHLDMVGANGLGLFYLQMRRGLDYLYNDPRVDRSRIAVTGLSGGGWQTIVLSSLDPRVSAAIPVAGFCSLTTAIEHPEYAGDDAEQNATDFRQATDYAQLVAMRAPRPTLLIYNAEDDCCFRAGVVKQGVYFDILPFFKLFGQEQNFRWHENYLPGTHNYQRDNREALYGFLNSAFGLNASPAEEADTDGEVRSYDDLVVGLPKDNLTILGLARRLGKSNHKAADAASPAIKKRELLRNVTRYQPVKVEHAAVIDSLAAKGVESYAYRFEFNNGLSATGVLFRSSSTADDAAAAILISDEGMKATKDEIANLASSGKRVLALEPLFFGQNIPGTGDLGVASYSQMLNGIGERALGLEAAQVAAVAEWLNSGLQHGSATPGAAPAARSARRPVAVLTSGPRSQAVALTSAALEPQLFASVDARHSIPSLEYVLEHPLKYGEVPELMCLDLFRDFDFDVLAALAAPAKVQLNAPDAAPITW